jgi:hypothetical protein
MSSLEMGLKGSVRKWLDDNPSNDMADYEESMHLAELQFCVNRSGTGTGIRALPAKQVIPTNYQMSQCE